MGVYHPELSITQNHTEQICYKHNNVGVVLHYYAGACKILNKKENVEQSPLVKPLQRFYLILMWQVVVWNHINVTMHELAESLKLVKLHFKKFTLSMLV